PQRASGTRNPLPWRPSLTLKSDAGVGPADGCHGDQSSRLVHVVDGGEGGAWSVGQRRTCLPVIVQIDSHRARLSKAGDAVAQERRGEEDEDDGCDPPRVANEPASDPV